MSATRKTRFAAILSSIAMIIGTLCVSAFAAPPANAGENPQYTDEYVLSPSYVSPDGKHLDEQDGLEVHSGSIDMNNTKKNDITTYSYLNNMTRINLGSSYVSSREVAQFVYFGEAYASGKQDFRTPESFSPKRIVEACFKYTRNGKDIIGWQCSRSSLGPTFTPGAVVKRTVHDNISLNGPKTQFRYSYKTY